MKGRTILIWMVLAVLVVAGVHRALRLSNQPGHLREIAEELGSIAEFRDPPSPSHSGDRLLVAQDSENGPGIFLCDLTTGSRKRLYEEKQENYFVQRFGLLGWSMDDSYFAYYRQYAPNIGAVELVICDGKSGSPLSQITVNCWLSTFVWLSSSNFAYLNDMQDMAVYEGRTNYGWAQTRYLKGVTGGKRFAAQCFAATSTNSVAWLLDGAIWSLDIDGASPVKLWESSTNYLVDFSYSREAGKFLLNCTNLAGHFLYTFDPGTREFRELDQLSCPVQDSIIKVGLINHGLGYSYLSNHADMISLFVKTNVASPAARLLGQGEIRTYTPGSERLFIPGSQTNEPRAVWEYTVGSGALQCVVPASSRPLHYARLVSPAKETATTADGKQFSYHLWAPVGAVSGRKYPVILGATPYSWTPYPQAAANLGYYFVTADRPGWGADSAVQWIDEVTALWPVLSKNPQIDTNRVFFLLYARSEETDPMTRFISKHPEVSYGAIVFDPGGALPDLSVPKALTMLIVAGQQDTNAVKNVTSYQKKAREAGRPATVAILENAKHDSFGTRVQTERLRRLVAFFEPGMTSHVSRPQEISRDI